MRLAFNVERIESAAGATHDYDSVAEKARANQRYAQGAAVVFRAILADLSRRGS